ncbi:hypothetical protein OESDEN_10401 [Oesophagostomum dentatum]|uniref:Uncharacterized protein n=1 Tax=Oesophagostomum dentatum TaxID=61180 RepID=A0A0B1T1V7_OESDE|nr:hypothetical protein OESDEN_10401 [Oesophagostomum dentatum]
MTTIRPFDVMDMLKFNNVNLDSMTETSEMSTEQENKKEKFSIFTGIQYGTTALAVLLLMRTSNKYITHAQRGKVIVGAAGCIYLSVAIEFGLFPFNFFVKERVPLRKS